MKEHMRTDYKDGCKMIQMVKLCVRHIKGDLNVLADILSRWGNIHAEEDKEKERDKQILKLEDRESLLLIKDEMMIN